MNNEKCFIFDDVMYSEKKIQMNQFLYPSLEVLVQVKISH
jgi:hypothetical protein